MKPHCAELGPDCTLVFGGQRYRASIGRSGISASKQEGDGATPSGLLPLRSVLYRPDRLAVPAALVPVSPLRRQDGWCDDPAAAEYNTKICLPHPARHEGLWRDDAVYDIVGILGWNDRPVVSGRGSAIFLHVARPDYSATEGCLSLAREDLLAVLAGGLREVWVTA